MAVLVEIVGTGDALLSAAARAFTHAPAEWSVRLVEKPSGEADVVVAEEGFRGSADVAFDPDRPDEAMAAVAARLRGRAAPTRTILVAGAAGGAGATTLALHLAAAGGRGVCVADVHGGLAARLGLPPDARTWLPNDDEVSSAALPVAGGLRVLCAPRPCPAPAHFPIAAARATFERIVVDAGTSRDLGPLVAEVDVAVLVVPPTRPGVAAARAVVSEHAEVGWAVVTNRTGPGGQTMRGALEAALGRPLALELPCCPALRDAEDDARLLSGSWHRWTRGVARLARAVEAR